jgi:hypothetical protein
MSDLNFSKPILLVPTIIIGIGVLGAIAYGIKSQFSGAKSNDVVNNNFGFSEEPVSDNGTVYSSDDETFRNPSLDSYQSVDSNGPDFRNSSFSSKGGSRKKTKRKGKKSKKSKSR